MLQKTMSSPPQQWHTNGARHYLSEERWEQPYRNQHWRRGTVLPVPLHCPGRAILQKIPSHCCSRPRVCFVLFVFNPKWWGKMSVFKSFLFVCTSFIRGWFKNLLWQTRRTLVPFSVVVSGCLAGLWQHPRRSGGDSGGRRRDHRREWEAGQGEDKSGGGKDDTSRPGTLGATVNNSTVTVHSCF